MSYKRYQPVFLDLNGRLCVVVGGGEIAYEKISVLLESGATVRVVAPSICAALGEIVATGTGGPGCAGVPPASVSRGSGRDFEASLGRSTIEWRQKPYDDSDLDGAFLVIAATDDATLNRQVSAAAEARGKLANAVDDAEYCNFIFGAVAKAGPLQVAVSSAGTSPIIAQQVRDHVQQSLLTDELGVLAEFVGDWRPAVKKAIEGLEARKRFWKDLLASRVPSLLADGKKGKAARALKELLRGAIHRSLGDASPESVSPRQYNLTESDASTDSPRQRTPIASAASVVIPSEARDTSNPTSSGDAPASLLARPSPPNTPAQQPNRRKSA